MFAKNKICKVFYLFFFLFWVNGYTLPLDWCESETNKTLSKEEAQHIEQYATQEIQQYIEDEYNGLEINNLVVSLQYRNDGKVYFFNLNGVDEETILINVTYICSEETYEKMNNAIYGCKEDCKDAKEKIASKKKISRKSL